MDNFAKNIKYLRLKNGLNQSEAAKIVTLTRTAWSEYENGWSKPRFADLLTIAAYFDVTLSELVEMDLEEGNPNDIFELRKIVKKGNLKGNVMGNLNSENCKKNIQDKEANGGVNPAVLDQLNRIERELRDVRSKLAQ